MNRRIKDTSARAKQIRVTSPIAPTLTPKSVGDALGAQCQSGRVVETVMSDEPTECQDPDCCQSEPCKKRAPFYGYSLESVQTLLASEVRRHRVLVDWQVVFREDGEHRGRCTIDPNKKAALVRPPEPEMQESMQEYLQHEVLHVAMAAVRRADDSYDAEELLVQDLCVMLGVKYEADDSVPDINICPKCNGQADRGFDRCVPPSPYLCSICDPHGAYCECDLCLPEYAEQPLRELTLSKEGAAAVLEMIAPRTSTSDLTRGYW